MSPVLLAIPSMIAQCIYDAAGNLIEVQHVPAALSAQAARYIKLWVYRLLATTVLLLWASSRCEALIVPPYVAFYTCAFSCANPTPVGSAGAVCFSPYYAVADNPQPVLPCSMYTVACHVAQCYYQGVPKFDSYAALKCPPGTTEALNLCFAPNDPRKDLDCNDSNEPICESANPVNWGSGTKRQRETDFTSHTLTYTRTFASYPYWRYGDAVGRNWSSNVHTRRVTFYPGDTNFTPRAEVDRGDSRRFVFNYAASQGTYSTSGDIIDRLTEQRDSNGNRTGWTYYDSAKDTTEQYDALGRIVTLQMRAGAVTTFAYYASGNLATVTDSLGRSLTFDYDSSGRVSHMTDPAGGIYDYAYDAASNPVSVTYPADSQGIRRIRTYVYENASLPNALTGVIDENGWRFATYLYDSTSGRATQSKHHATSSVDADNYRFNYLSSSQTIVTDPLGTARTYSLTVSMGEAIRMTGTSQPCPYCGNANASAITHDSAGNMTSKTDFNGKMVCYAYDTTRNLEIVRVEGLLSSERCSTALLAPPSRPDVRKITTSWHPTYRLPVTITEPAAGGSKTTTISYDASGNTTQKSIVAPRNDGGGGTATRTWSWTYITRGRVLTATDPNGKVTTYTYYPDSDPDFGKRGNVATITNPLGHITQFTAYGRDGRLLTIVNPDGLATTLVYDARGRLISRNVGGEATGYAYDGVGQLTRATLPDGSYIVYTYDGAHRLTQIADGLGNRIIYTLDAMGNRIREQAFDAAGTLARTRSRQYDALNRLAAELGAQGQTTSYAYDNNANLAGVTDPLTHATGNSYDALNRLTQVLDPNQGVTQYVYDPAGDLTQVIDPRSLATSYTYDGLGNLIRQVSPDTGMTANTYDAAGNVLTRIDARGVSASAIYDDLNRATQIVYSKSGSPSETHLFTYDLGVNAKGRLSQVSDSAAQTAWTFTPQGRVASKAQTVSGTSLTLGYDYNSAGQLTRLTTPSGQQVVYAYANNRVASITVNGQTLLSGAGTEPFGPLAGWRWGNGLNMFRDYDSDGRLAAWEYRNGTSLLRKEQSFDDAGHITAITDPLNPAGNQTYSYDVLDRLNLAQSGSPVAHTQQFAYDAVGNRLNATIDSAAASLAYGANNRLQAMTGAVPAGYLLGGGTWNFTYNNANRLAAANGPSISATYKVNAQGQRVSKTVGSLITYFVYDEQGHLAGEYDSGGNLIQETIWLEHLPVATLRPNGTGNPVPVAIYYVHADHLGSPRAITRPADNAVMWRWDNVDPFGANPANENPSGQGTFNYGLRFPGQYYDAETGTNYNYFRDYDPVIGRYEQSDPIGMFGGVNTYAYAGEDPVISIDPLGLIRIYGNWCGPDWTGGFESSWINLTPGQIPHVKPPIDQLDGSCMSHDLCYGQCERDFPCDPASRGNCFRFCDRSLAAQAFRIGGLWGNGIGLAMSRPGARRDPGPNSNSCCANPGNTWRIPTVFPSGEELRSHD